MDPVTLDRWIEQHGGLGVDIALVLVLRISSEIGRMPSNRRVAAGAGITSSRIQRTADGWVWSAAEADAPSRSRSHHSGERAAVPRLGALLFHCLAGRPLSDAYASEQSVRDALRSVRADLSGGVVDLTARAAAGSPESPPSLDGFANEARRLLGIEPPAHSRLLAGGALAMVAAAGVLLFAWANRGTEIVTSFGLTELEIVVRDSTAEAAQSFALTEEHTAAVELYRQLKRFWQRRLPLEDPRIVWTTLEEAWVRLLAGDRLTAEQAAEAAPARLADQLGTHHPYTRTSRLMLAAVLDARGVRAESDALRALADTDARTLLDRPSGALDVLDSLPLASGVIAHTEPNLPEREGFRRAADGTYAAPLTSVQRWLAGRDGWRLHVVASGVCEVSVVLGDPARRFTLTMNQDAGHRWHTRFEGASTPIETVADATARLGASVLAVPKDGIRLRTGGEFSNLVSIGATAEPPLPPHSLTFRPSSQSKGCEVVWLEIPMPVDSDTARTLVALPAGASQR